MKTTAATNQVLSLQTEGKGYAVQVDGKVVATYLFSAKGTKAIYSKHYATKRCEALCASGQNAQVVVVR